MEGGRDGGGQVVGRAGGLVKPCGGEDDGCAAVRRHGRPFIADVDPPHGGRCMCRREGGWGFLFFLLLLF